MEEEEEEGIGDVDLFSLINEHTKLTINAKWLQHLQVRAHATRLPKSIVEMSSMELCCVWVQAYNSNSFALMAAQGFFWGRTKHKGAFALAKNGQTDELS